jgi:hypothetical protein
MRMTHREGFIKQYSDQYVDGVWVNVWGRAVTTENYVTKTRIYRRETRKFASAGEFKLASIFIAKKKITSLSSAMSK